MSIYFTTSWKPTGTKSFRLAASQFVIDKSGGNAQNPDKLFMTCVEPRPGNVFVQADQSGAEALIVANECRAGRFRSLFDNGIKPHTYMALQIFREQLRGEHSADRYWAADPAALVKLPEWSALNKRISKSKECEQMYFLGKKVIHAKNYDMKWKTYIDNVLVTSHGDIVLSAAEGKYHLNTHEVLFPEILEQQERVKTELHTTRILHNLFGHPRRFEKRMTADIEREALSFIPQSTVGEITNRACVTLQNYIDDTGKAGRWHFANNKHDSLMAEVPAEDGMECAKLLNSLLCVKLTSTTGITYYMKSEVAIGKNWGKYDEEHNPDGMNEVKI